MAMPLFLPRGTLTFTMPEALRSKSEAVK